MPRRQRSALSCCTLLLVTLAATVPLRAATAHDLYTAALAHERELRTPGGQPVSLEQLRDAIAAYEEIVRRFPRSGYSDNALWQAAGLAFQAFDYHRQAADRDTAARLLRVLERDYPSSSLVPRVTDRLEQIDFLDEPVRIRAIRREPLADIVRVTIELDDEAPYHAERLDGPARLFFDFSGTYAPPPLRDATLAFDDSDLVREIRLGRHPGHITRVVLDIEDVDSFSVYTLYNPYRLVVDTVPTASRQARRATQRMPAPPAAAGDAGPPPTDRVDDPVPVDSPPTLLSDEALGGDEVLTGSEPAASVEPNATDGAPAQPSTPSRLRAPNLLPVPQGWELRRLDTTPPVDEPHDGDLADPGPAPSTHEPVTGPEPPEASAPTAPPDELHSLAPLQTPGTVAPADVLPHPRLERLTPIVSPAPGQVEATAPEPAGEWFAQPPEPRAGAEAPVANSDGDFSLARQLGLGVSRIVIDPGHGGYDPGAQAGDLTESALVLDVARRLEARLKAATDIEVILTRRRDTFLPLRARTELANRVHADLFLSIHANAAKDPRARGIETYYLDLATDPSAQTVAARENAASREDMHDLSQLARSITMNSKLDESRDVAEMVQRNLILGVRELHPEAQDLGVKQAPFVVLLGANMPSVLAEISFLTNQADAAFLATDAYRDRIADALLQSILEYQQTLKPSVSFAADAEND